MADPDRPRYEVTIRKLSWARHLWIVVDTESARVIDAEVAFSDDGAKDAAIDAIAKLSAPEPPDQRTYSLSQLQGDA